jgi:hypothetical protein
MTFSSASNLSSWRDKSGAGNHFSSNGTSTTSSNDGGYNIVNFPSGAVMTSANQITFTTSSAFFIVSKLTTNSGIAMLLGFTNITPSGAVQGDFSIRFTSANLVGTAVTSGGSGELGNNNYYVNGSFNPSFGSSTYYNVYSIIDTVTPVQSGTSVITLSSDFYGRYFIGKIAEFLYYPGGVTSAQRQQIESYLAQKWGITLTVAPTIPVGTLPLVTNLIGVPRRNMIPKPIVIATGGTIVTANGYRTHTYTTVGSSNFVLTSTVPGLSFQVLVVSGGGAGGGNVGGGGGAGGAQLLTPTLSVGSYTVIVGNGGAIDSGTGQGQSGGSSTFNATTIVGGGAGGVYGANAGLAGACGGGAGNNYTFGTGSVGSNGGSTSGICGGGGGGMDGAGTSGSGYNGGTGGAGLSYTIGGVSYTVCGGGGGAGYDVAGTAGVGGSGGSGVGAAGATVNNQPGGAPTPTANRGGGGGGGTNNGNDAASAGAAGIVIVSYVYS